MADNGNKNWLEYLRVITPFLCLVITGFSAIIYGKIGDIDNKLFDHLTNAELHFPRTQVVTKLEYEAVTKMRDQQWVALTNQIAELKVIICDRRGF